MTEKTIEFKKVLHLGGYSFTDFPERKTIFDADKKLTQKAYKIICDMWNKDQKSRGFIQHLVGSFFPINNFNKIFFNQEPIRCAILGIKLAGIKQIAEGQAKIGMEKMFIDAHAGVENRETLTQEEIKKLNNLRQSLPVEIRESSIAYFSDSSTKLLSAPALVALNIVIEELLFSDSREIHFTLNKKRISEVQKEKKEKLSENEINRIAKVTTYGVGDNLDSKTLDALTKLKLQLEK